MEKLDKKLKKSLILGGATGFMMALILAMGGDSGRIKNGNILSYFSMGIPVLSCAGYYLVGRKNCRDSEGNSENCNSPSMYLGGMHQEFHD